MLRAARHSGSWTPLTAMCYQLIEPSHTFNGSAAAHIGLMELLTSSVQRA